MIDFYQGTYDFEDSLYAPHFILDPITIEFEREPDGDDDRINDNELDMTLVAQLGSRPTNFPRAFGAADFAGMLEDLASADSMIEKAEMLSFWSQCFHGTMAEQLANLAEAIKTSDEATARKLIAKICA
ncbi:MAG: hypothetical protein Q4A96_04575 [Candidatus Saccharibacteria bacterium]|nr:hypothetical protein [Candidatus Saccharibacteria bacterium]